MNARSWQDNATEFRELDAGEGWVFARLIACSVTYRPGANGPIAESLRTGKVGVRGFGDAAGCSADRIQDYYKAWELAADAGVVPHASDLKPESVPSIQLPDNIEHPWSTYSRKAREWRDAPGKSYERTANGNPERLVAAMSKEQREAVVKEIVQVSEPAVVLEVHRAARERILDDHEELNRHRVDAEQRERESRKSRHTLRYIETGGLLAAAARKLREAATTAHGVEFTDEEREDLLESVGRARTALDVVTTVIAGDSDVDWDAELARMGAE